MSFDPKTLTKKQLAYGGGALAALVAIILALVLPTCGTRDAGQVVGKDVPPGDVGTPSIASEDDEPLQNVAISVVNAEELYVRFAGEGLAQASGTPDKLRVQVIVSPEAGGGTWTRTVSGADLKARGDWDTGANEIDVVLDSLREGREYAAQTDDAGTHLASVVKPGENMRVLAAVSYDGKSARNGDGEVANSLFASVAEKDGRRTAGVSFVRHLLNLDAGRASEKAYEAASIDADLSLAGGTWNDAANVSVSARKDGKAVCPFERIAPIQLVSAADTSDGLVAGNDHVLRGFAIGDAEHPASDTGLFRSLSCEVGGMRIANARVVGAARTGALAGSLKQGANVHDCQVLVEAGADGSYDYDAYAVRGAEGVGGLVGTSEGARIASCTSTVSVYGSSDVGGLVGSMAAGSIEGSGARAAASAATVGADVVPPMTLGKHMVGGLVGSVRGAASIEGSFAALNVLSEDDDIASTLRFGGLVGSFEGSSDPVATIRSCYAAGDVRVENEGGGLLGRAESVEVSDCFCLGNVSCDSNGAGFVGVAAGTGGIWNSTSYGLVLNVDGGDVASNGGFFALVEGDAFSVDDTNAYLRDVGYNEVASADVRSGDGPFGNPKSVDELMLDEGGITNLDKLHPYKTELVDTAFPFADATGIGEVWGSWPAWRTARWYAASGDLVLERSFVAGSDVRFPAALCYAENLQSYYAEEGPYQFFDGWDAHYEENGDYSATARADPVPLQELFPDEPWADWAVALREALGHVVDAEFVAKEDFEIDSMAPDSPFNPDTFSYQVTGAEGQRPVMTIGQRLPAFGGKAEAYRVLRFVMGGEELQVGYANATEREKDGIRYFAYDGFIPDDVTDRG